MNRIRVLIADDHEVVRTGIRQVLALASDIEIIAEAVSGDEVLTKVRTQAFDVVLTDLAMPGVCGIDLISRIKAACPAASILVHSMYTDGQTATRALAAGATGYVSNGSDAANLVEGVRQVVRGRKFISPDLIDEVLSNLGAEMSGLTPRPRRLTEREFEVFRMLIEGKSSNDVAVSLSLSPKTISTHKIRLMRKLNVKNHAEMLRYAITHKFLI